MASCLSSPDCCSRWSGAGRGTAELPGASPQPSVKHGWCTTLWPNSPITEALQQKNGFAFFFFLNSTEKPGNTCPRDINTCRSAKNWKQASSLQFPIHILERWWCFIKKPLSSLFPMPYFQALPSFIFTVHSPGGNGGTGVVVLAPLQQHLVLVQQKYVWCFSGMRSFPAPGFPFQRELHWKEMSSQ